MTDDRNISTEHQRDGDAKRPSDTLNKDQGLTPKAPSPSQGTDTGIGETGDAHKAKQGDFNPEAKEESRQATRNQGQVSPDDYQDRESGDPDYS